MSAAERTVSIPAILIHWTPAIASGFLINLGISMLAMALTTLLGTLIGELFASSQGLGFMLIRAMDSHNVPDIMALTFLLFLVATCANSIILAIEHRVRAHAV